MRTLLLTGLTAFGLAWGALGQGSFDLDNSELANGIAIDTPGNWYNGVYGVEVWELNGTNTTDLVNALNYGCNSSDGYALLVANGFHKEATYFNQTMREGTMTLGSCQMPDVSPAGSTVTLALVAWNGDAPSFAAVLNGSAAGTRAGIIAFLQPTAFSSMNLPPAVPAPLAWGVNLDLVLYPPERPPAIARQPEDTTAVLGGTATFSILVGNDDIRWPLDYQWLFNGNEIPAAAYTSLLSTNAKFPQLITCSLILTNVQLTNAGQYSLLVSNAWGGTLSSNALLTLTFPPPSLSIARAGQGVTLSWPIWATNYALQQAAAFSAPTATWSNLAVTPVIGPNDRHVTLQPAAGEKFYRLEK
jgi:hypothetical protein